MSAALDAHKERLAREWSHLDGGGLLRLAVQSDAVSDGLPGGDGVGTRVDTLRIVGALATMAAERSHETTWPRADVVSLATRSLTAAGEHDEAKAVALRFAHTWKVEPIDPNAAFNGRTGLRLVFTP